MGRGKPINHEKVEYAISLINSLTKEQLVEALETFERDYAKYLKKKTGGTENE